MANFQTHIIFKTYEDVKNHFLDNPMYMDEEDVEILRLDHEDKLVLQHSDYEGCHVFIAFYVATGREMNIPRAVLPKNKCTEEDDYEIQQIGYVDFLEDSNEFEDDLFPPDSPDPYPCDESGPGSGDSIN